MGLCMCVCLCVCYEALTVLSKFQHSDFDSVLIEHPQSEETSLFKMKRPISSVVKHLFGKDVASSGSSDSVKTSD